MEPQSKGWRDQQGWARSAQSSEAPSASACFGYSSPWVLQPGWAMSPVQGCDHPVP